MPELRISTYWSLKALGVISKNLFSGGLLLRLTSVDDNIRLASLTVFKHLINSSLEQVQPRMKDIFDALHSKLNDGTMGAKTKVLTRKVLLLESSKSPLNLRPILTLLNLTMLSAAMFFMHNA